MCLLGAVVSTLWPSVAISPLCTLVTVLSLLMAIYLTCMCIMAATGSVSQLYSLFLEPLPLTLVSLFTLSKILLSITHRISLSLMALSIFSFPCRISLSLSGRYLSLCLWPVFIPYFPLLLSSNDPGQGSISYGIISRANNFPDEGGERSHPTTPHASKLLQHVRT